ncbi:MAG: polysaccharide biosynthesis C-terminal domain-containing protein, partial [Eubacteriales bacterium]
IPLWGVAGFFVAIFSGTILNSLLSLRRLVRVTKIHLDVMGWIVKPFLAAGASGSGVLLLFNIWAPALPGGLLLIMEISATVLLYIGFLFWTNCVTREDADWFKKRFTNAAPLPRPQAGRSKM